MKQFPNLRITTFETDERKNEALDGLLTQAGVQRVGRLTVVSAFRGELDAARRGGGGVIAAANVIIVGNIVKPGDGAISSSHVGNGALVALAEHDLAYPLDYVIGSRDRYPETIPAVTLGFGEDSENAAYARATGELNVYPFGGGAPARMERALTEASVVLGVPVAG